MVPGARLNPVRAYAFTLLKRPQLEVIPKHSLNVS
jgi:hypothetical protein